jgi:hypothetical protein
VSDEIKDVNRKYYEMWSTSHSEELQELLHPECVHHLVLALDEAVAALVIQAEVLNLAVVRQLCGTSA